MSKHDIMKAARAALSALSILCIGLTAADAGAVEVELKHDSFADNGQAVCQQGFAIGDQGGVTFTHGQAFQLLRVQFLFCGADTTQQVTVRVYRDGGGAVPGETMYEGVYQIEGSSEALSEIDVSSENLQFNAGESFRVALVHEHDGAPGLGNDTDGVTPGANWIFDTASGANGAWAESSQFGVTGDWIMRAYIDVDDGMGSGGGAPTSSGAMMGGSGGTGGEGGADGGDDGSDGEDSCSCGVVGAPQSQSALWLALVALGALIRRRRG